ncbi:hypothetical protein LCGC14_1192440 [marine sediment metagenome]|uniref:Uncharacterized protein n=1 Tax=marine sediment metagenome TaxID=412755 RepID=A0A0F9LNR4_9ZZZZ
MLVTSNNGRVHLAEYATKGKNPKEYPGAVRKLCDGQWVFDEKEVKDRDVTCPVCEKK